MFFFLNLCAEAPTQGILCIIFCIIWVKSPVWISGGCAVSYFLLPPVFCFYRKYIFFCRRNFSFAVTYFFFAARFFLLSRVISFFWPREFLFCREFSFFCPDLFLFSCDTCGPSYCSLLSANFEILKIAVLKNFQTRMKVMEFFFSKVGG